jgi:hypothetical protein
LASCLLAATLGRAVASERSEVLTAKGEVAFHTGHPDEARRLLAEAVAADPRDVDAQYALGVVLNAAEQWDDAARAFERALALRPDLDAARRGLDQAHARTAQASPGEAEAKPWGVHATTGVGYDSNVKIAPQGDALPGIGKRDDAAFILGGGGHYDLIAHPDALLRLEYDVYQTLHPELDDFDFRSHRVRATASYALRPELWVGMQGGYSHYTLGTHSYLGEAFFMPFVSVVEQTWGVTQVSYRHGEDTYFSKPFDNVRDGPNEAVGLDQTLFLGGGRALSMGYLYAEENPRRTAANVRQRPRPEDYQFHAHQAYVGVSVPLWWRVGLDLTYLYRSDDYPNPNSFASFRTSRHDEEHHVSTALRRPITSHLSAMITYYATVNGSNIDVFDYRRHVVSGLLQVTY